MKKILSIFILLSIFSQLSANYLNYNKPQKKEKTLVILKYNDLLKSRVNKIKYMNKIPVCDINVGKININTNDFLMLSNNDLGNDVNLKGYTKWLNLKNKNALNFIKHRIKEAKVYGCKVILLEDLYLYNNNTGFNISKSENNYIIKEIVDFAKNMDLLIGKRLNKKTDKNYDIEKLFDFFIK